MANYKIEVFGPVLSEKMRSAGVTSTDKLLAASKTKAIPQVITLPIAFVFNYKI